MLADLGHAVVATAGRLDKALVSARDAAFDLGILDLNLKGEDTYVVADVLAGRGIPFIFSTGYDRARLRQPYRDGPMIQKPYLESDLRDMIGTAVG
jgi:CheY-like chemotaxis protein